jgi:hypothetical protein
MPLYTFLQNMLNVLVQIANKMGLQKKMWILPKTLLCGISGLSVHHAVTVSEATLVHSATSSCGGQLSLKIDKVHHH